MHFKLLITFLIAINCYSSCAGALRRTPKVYNALITTDDNLTSSRAYPVIQPTLYENGLAHHPFGPYPFDLHEHSLVRFGQPIAPGLSPREQIPYALPPQSLYPPRFFGQPPNAPPQAFPGYAKNPAAPQEAKPATMQPNEEQQPVKPPAELPPAQQPPKYMPMSDSGPKVMPSPNDKLPIPLNQFGFPPSLIPLPPQQPAQQPGQNPTYPLPPFGYNQFPVAYNPTGYRHPYHLPPYQYFPPHNYVFHGNPALAPPQPPVANMPAAVAPTASAPATTEQPEDSSTEEPEPEYEAETEEEEIDDDLEMTTPSLDSIKNGSKNKDVPDVPPPPIPSGAKAKKGKN